MARKRAEAAILTTAGTALMEERKRYAESDRLLRRLMGELNRVEFVCEDVAPEVWNAIEALLAWSKSAPRTSSPPQRRTTLMCDACRTVPLKVYIQENGIIRLEGTGLLIGRLVDGVTFEDLRQNAAAPPNRMQALERLAEPMCKALRNIIIGPDLPDTYRFGLSGELTVGEIRELQVALAALDEPTDQPEGNENDK